MAWTTARTWVTGELVTASMGNTHWRDNLNYLYGARCQPGMIVAYAGSSAPSADWLFPYGQNVSRTTYADLFAAISTQFGVGDGSTTFGLPDLRGRGFLFLDNMGGSDAGRLSVANTLGGSGGTETHTLVEGEIPSHLHTVDPPSTVTTGQSATHTHNIPRGDNAAAGNSGNLSNSSDNDGNNVSSVGSADHTHTVDIAQFNSGSYGGGGAHNNLSPYQLLNALIKT